MSNLRDRLKSRLAQKKVDLEPATTVDVDAPVLNTEEQKERQRRLKAIDGDSDLKKLRAVSGTTDKVVLNHAINTLSKIEVGCWAEILRTAELSILKKAVARLQDIDGTESVTTLFSALSNTNIDEKLFDTIADLAKKDKKLAELFYALPDTISTAQSRKLAKIYVENKVEKSPKGSYGIIPLRVHIIFLMVSSGKYDLNFVAQEFYYCVNYFSIWVRNADRIAAYEIGSMLVLLLNYVAPERDFKNFVTALDFLKHQQIRG